MADIRITSLDKLPERCCDCPCCNRENGTCQAIEDYRTSDWRPFWCPLKEQDDQINQHQQALKRQ